MFKGKTKNGVDIFRTFGFQKKNHSKWWVVLGQRAGATIYEVSRPSTTLKLLKQIPFPSGRKKDRELGSDEPGRGYDTSRGSKSRVGVNSNHGLVSELSPHEVLAQKFANGLAELLTNAKDRLQFDRLVLVAEPRFMGIIKNALPQRVGATVIASIGREITPKLGENEVRAQVNTLVEEMRYRS